VNTMWLTLLKVSLIVWLAVAVAAMVIVGLRRSRRNRSDPNWSRGPGALPGYAASIRGTMPATPLPEWVDWDEDQPDPDARDDKTAHLQSEVNRLAAKLNVEPIEVGRIMKDDDRNVYVDDDADLTMTTGSAASRSSIASARSMTSSTGSLRTPRLISAVGTPAAASLQTRTLAS
jgi:hypothetical protein